MTSAAPTVSLACRLSSSSGYICYVRVWWLCLLPFTCHSRDFSEARCPVPANVSLPSSGGEGRSQSLLPCPGSRNVHRQDTCPGAARGVRVRPQRLHTRSLRYQSIAPGIPLLHVEHQRLRFASVCVLHVACLTLHLIHCALAAGSALTQEMCGSAPLAFGVGPSVHRPLHTLRALRAPARCCVTGCLEPRPFLVAQLTHPHPAGSSRPRPSSPRCPLPAAGVAGLRLARILASAAWVRIAH